MLKLPSFKSASIEPPASTDPKRVSHYRTVNDQARLASSDLEDCEEVWIEELSDYVLETQKRQNEVERRFEGHVLVSKLIPRILVARVTGTRSGHQFVRRDNDISPVCRQGSPPASRG